jgi:hypothetical protein
MLRTTGYSWRRNPRLYDWLQESLKIVAWNFPFAENLAFYFLLSIFYFLFFTWLSIFYFLFLLGFLFFTLGRAFRGCFWGSLQKVFESEIEHVRKNFQGLIRNMEACGYIPRHVRLWGKMALPKVEKVEKNSKKICSEENSWWPSTCSWSKMRPGQTWTRWTRWTRWVSDLPSFPQPSLQWLACSSAIRVT